MTTNDLKEIAHRTLIVIIFNLPKFIIDTLLLVLLISIMKLLFNEEFMKYPLIIGLLIIILLRDKFYKFEGYDAIIRYLKEK